MDLEFTQVIVRELGLVGYQDAFDRMRKFTAERDSATMDEFWVLQHGPVYTQGYSCSDMPRDSQNIPVVSTDRGGRITYHGPGQLIIYLLLDIKRRKQGIRHLVHSIESAIVGLLESYDIFTQLRSDAPGVYVNGRKVASLGIRISHGCSYHGMSLNVDMDTAPFECIDVCGIRELEVTTLRELGVLDDMDRVQQNCVTSLSQQLGYEKVSIV